MITSLVQWLNINQGATSALLTAVYVIATIVLVIISIQGTQIAHRSLEAAHRFEQERSRPFVSFMLVNQPAGVVQMIVENIGATAAYNIRFAIEPTIQIVEGGPQVDPPEVSKRPHPFISNGLAFLPPKAREQNLVALSFKQFQSFYPEQLFKGIISYTDARGQKYEDPVLIDLSTQRGLGFLSEPTAAEELRRIHDLLRDILGKKPHA